MMGYPLRILQNYVLHIRSLYLLIKYSQGEAALPSNYLSAGQVGVKGFSEVDFAQCCYSLNRTSA